MDGVWMMDNFKETTLKGHIQMCELRYKSLEGRLDNVEQRLAQIESKVNDLGSQIQSNMLEIRVTLEKANSRRDVQVVATLGTIIVAVITAVGLWIAK
jgi:predicted  nucleic acid-binding Zn-ribbon protein